jgi:predicted permease
MMTLWQDIRYGVRMLRKNPGFTTVAVLTLALGIGANTAIFTLIDTLLLTPLPVPDPQQLALVTEKGHSSLPYPLYEQLRDGSHCFRGVFAADSIDKRRLMVPSASGDRAESVWTQAVSGEFFSVLGVPAALGRPLTPEDDRRGDPQAVAVISYGFWQRSFGLDPTVIGKTVLLDDIPFVLVGVMPPGFFGFEVGRSPDLWWPLHMVPRVAWGWQAKLLDSKNSQWLRIMGRLKPGVARAQAQSELDVIFQQMRGREADEAGLSGTEREKFLDSWIALEPGGAGHTLLRDDFRWPLYILMAIVSLVLLVACANLAGLLLARGAARGREFGVRAALGAGRLTLVRQLVVESLLLAGVGGALGLVLAQGGARWLAGYLPGYGQNLLLQLTPDRRVLMFTMAVSAGTGLFFGLLPAWRATRPDLVTTLKNEAGSVLGRAPGQIGNKLLVIAQIALTCVLLIGAGLFVRTLRTLQTLDAGFRRDNLMVFGLDLGRNYDNSRRAHLHREILRQLEYLPGVQSASLASVFSLGNRAGYFMPNLTADGATAKPGESLHCRGIGVAPNYLRTMGIPLLAGRDFGPEDLPPGRAAALRAEGGTDEKTWALRKVILSESVAKRLFGQENPVGKRLREWRPEPTMEVIGVARDARHRQLRDEPFTTLFYHVDMEGADAAFYVRTQGSALSLAGGIRRVVHEVAPDVEVTGLRTMGAVADDQLYRERALSVLASFFSLLTLALACLGLYGILAYAVTRRTREIGIRMALGAQRHNVLSAVIRQGMMLTLAGCGLGVILAVAFTRVVSSLLYGVTPNDPVTFILTVLLLSVVALVSCWLPARRAAKIDPMVALRYE